MDAICLKNIVLDGHRSDILVRDGRIAGISADSGLRR